MLLYKWYIIEEKPPSWRIWDHLDLFFVSSQIPRKTQKQETPALARTRGRASKSNTSSSAARWRKAIKPVSPPPMTMTSCMTRWFHWPNIGLIMLVMLGLGIVYRTEITNTKYYVYILCVYIYIIIYVYNHADHSGSFKSLLRLAGGGPSSIMFTGS